ncbi:MAG: mandelate racemase/muconate lactonizing enzyme family protein [Planctomycetaceae bacterium]
MNDIDVTQPINRRNLLFSAATSAAGISLVGSLNHSVRAAETTEDRTSSIRITQLTPHLFHDRVYVKVETNLGIIGWGEIKGIVPTVAQALATSLFELLDDQNPTRIEHLWQSMYRAERNQRGGAFMLHCIAGIDMALWDITGKLWGVPVNRLLGGPTRDSIPVYPSEKAVKIGTGPLPLSGNPADIQALVDRVRAARKQVGEDGVVMFDAHSAIPPATLIQFANAIEPYDLLFLEEPAVPGNIEVFRRIRQSVKVPLAAGERDRTIWGILPYLTEGILDIVQPDCGYTGGISQMRKIATLAEAYTVPLAPHCTQSYLGMTASFQVAAFVPQLLIHEAYDDELFARFIHPSWTKENGQVSIPDGPGLGVELDEKLMGKLANEDLREYEWRGPKFLPDGSVSDY